MSGDNNLEVSSMCATFAETEVISLLAQGAATADIAASVHKAVASRTLGLVAQVGKASPVVMTGGVAKNRALVHYLSQALRMPIDMLDEPQIAGAYGAALIARDEHIGNAALAAADRVTAEQFATGLTVAVPHCTDCDGHLGTHANHGPVSVTISTRPLVDAR
jgi:tRNA A37 threonylcarbamoyltransferase TsaD